jgi:HSP20 family protein
VQLVSERWEPLSELEQLTERMRRLFDQTMGFSWPAAETESRGWSPAVDLEEAGDAYVLEAELAGVKREDVTIELLGTELTISGEVPQRERTATMRRQARRTGRFEYRVTLPDQVDADRIEANLADGVLTVRLPKSASAQPRRIQVNS